MKKILHAEIDNYKTEINDLKNKSTQLSSDRNRDL